MNRFRHSILPAATVAVIGLLVALIFRDEPPATWLRVEAPPTAVAGQPFLATVTLLEPTDGEFLTFDLHGHDSAHRSLLCVAPGRAQAVSSAQHNYTFLLTVPGRPDLVQVHAIIFLSRTGRWADQFRVARSDRFDVQPSATGNASVAPVALDVHDLIPDPAIAVPNPPLFRTLIVLIWLTGAVLSVAAWRRQPSPRRRPVLTVILVACALWEATAAGTALSEFGRAIAHDQNVYEDRQTFQKLTTAGAILGLGLLAAAGLRRSRQHISGLTLAGLALYAGTTLAGTVTLHEVDRVLAFAIGPVPLAVLLRLAAAVLAASGMAMRVARGI